MKQIFFDIETTGLPENKGFGVFYNPRILSKYQNARMIELGFVVKSDHDETIEESYLAFDDTINVPENVHNITKEELRLSSHSHYYVLSEFSKHLTEPCELLSYNIGFDINILMSECYRLGREDIIDKIKKCKLTCIMNMGRKMLKRKYNVKLSQLAQIAGCKIEQNHRALSDVHIAMACYDYIIKNTK